MIVMGAGTNHWFHSDQTYRSMLALVLLLRLPGRQRRRLGALRRPGEGAPDHRLVDRRVRARLVAPAAPAARDPVLVPGHRPVALRDASAPSEFTSPAGNGSLGDRHTADCPRAGRPARLAAVVPELQPQPARPLRRGARARRRARRARRLGAARRAPALRLRGPRRPRQLPAGAVALARQPARLVEQGSRVLPPPPPRASPTRRSARANRVRSQRPSEVEWHDEAPDRKARPVHDARLPHERVVHLLRRRPPGGHLVREARPLEHRPAPVRPSVQRGDPAAVGDEDRLGRLQPDRRPSSAGSPPTTSARAPTWSPRRSCTTRPRSSPSRWARSATGGPANASRSPAGRCRSWSRSSATTPPSPRR